MKTSSFSVLNIMKSEPVTDYACWKKRRNELVGSMGPLLLQFNETELSVIFADMETNMRQLKQIQGTEAELFMLLEVSVLHFFRRSYDQIKRWFPVISGLFASPTRDVCRAATVCLRYLAEENSDNLGFLREALDLAKGYLSPSQRAKYIYNALAILREVGRFVPTDVFGVTLSHFPEIWKAVCSEDFQLRMISVKVINIHLTHMPLSSNIQGTFAESLYFDCNNKFTSKQKEGMHGPVLVCRSVFRMFPATFSDQRVIKLMESLNAIATIKDANLLSDLYQFVNEIAIARKTLIPPAIALDLTTAMISHIMAGIGVPGLLEDLISLMKTFTELKICEFPAQKVINMVEFCAQNAGFKKYSENVFAVLVEVFTLFPGTNAPLKIFMDAPPSQSYLKAIQARTNYLRDLKKCLLDQFHKGLQSDATEDQQIISISLVNMFDKLLFDLNQALFTSLRPFTYSGSEKVRYLMAETLPLFKALPGYGPVDELIRLAVLDESEQVRLAAVENIRPEFLVRNPDCVLQLLADPSFVVRRAAIPLIAASAKVHSVYIVPFVIVFSEEYLTSKLLYSSPSKAATTCSLFPLLAEHFVQFAPPLIPTLAWFSILFLSHGDPINEIDPSVDLGGVQPLDLRTIIHRDFPQSQSSWACGEVIGERDIDRARIYQIENEKWLEERDEYLFQTLGKLSNHLAPYLLQVIPVFVKAFKGKHERKVYLAALDTLTKIVVAIQTRVNLMLYFPDLLRALLSLMANEDIDEDIAVNILKLTGTMGVSKSSAMDTGSDEKAVEHFFAVKSPSYFTNFVMKGLVEMLKTPSPSVFEAITCIFVKDSEFAIPFLKPVIEGFVQAIEHNPSNLLFHQLEFIVQYGGFNVVPYVSLMKNMLVHYSGKSECMKISLILSYQLKSKFCEIASLLYPLAIRNLTSPDLATFKLSLKFIDYAIFYQNQSIELFLETVERYLPTLADEARISCVMKAISRLVQTKNISVYSARLARLCFSLLRTKRLPAINQLIYNLCLFGRLQIEAVERNLEKIGVTIPNLSDLRKAFVFGEAMLDQVPFVKKLSTNLITMNPNEVLVSINSVIKDVFTDVPTPQYNNTRQWLEDLSVMVVSNSPSVAIRACAAVSGQSQAFRQELFPVAFFSCWKVADLTDKIKFSEIVKKSLVRFDIIEPQLIQLAEMLDRAGDPLLVPDNIMAQACKIPSLSLYYLQRHLRDHPSDKETVLELLNLNSKMGRLDSARGVLACVERNMQQEDKGRWSEELGEWEKAMEIYERQTDKRENLSGLLRCYAHLEQWEKIKALSGKFHELSDKEKEENALWFAWAEFHANNPDKVKEFIACANGKELNVILFKSIFLVSCNEFDKALQNIELGFKALTENRSVFNGSNTNEASSRMVYAQHLIELQEVIQMKKENSINPPEMWQNRLKNFSQESHAWMKLVDIRSLVLSPAEHSESYMKMLSVLRQERKWRLIDEYCARFFSKSPTVDVLIARVKIMWSRNWKPKALSLIDNFTSVIKAKTLEEFEQACKNTSPENAAFLCAALGAGSFDGPIEETFARAQAYTKRSNLADRVLPRLLRLQAKWQYSLYTSKTSPATSLLQISKLFEESLAIVSNDYRSWAGYAYANSRSLSHFPELRSKCALNAISGFLKATQLRPSESLEYMCQMFSIFFRYGDVIELTESIGADIVSLPASIVLQIIPQIVVHIAHKDKNVRQVVQDIINLFGTDHFQAVVFPLNVLSLIQDKQKAEIALDLMESLGSKHADVYSDARMFIDGLHRGAVSWLERWLAALDTASRAQQMNDRDAVVQLIENQYQTLSKTACDLDVSFVRTFGQTLQRCKIAFDKYKNGDNQVTRQMWDGFRGVFGEMEDKIKKMEVIQLAKVSEDLANKRTFALSIPGTYDVDSPSPQLELIEPMLHVLNSQQHPRIVFMTDTEGTRYKFLLKGNEDLRLDQRIMQFFNLINSLLKSNRNTADLEVSILKYPIVPFAPNAGLITWVTGADTFQQLVSDFRSHREIRQSIELEIAQQAVGGIFNSLAGLQRYEVFEIVEKQMPANELREMLWLRSPDPSAWLTRNRNFTVSTALMSMAGYTIGLGDRHPSNIMVQRHTGRVIHIDFGDSFEVAMNRPQFAEQVPFRMTRMIVNALDGSSVEGLFRRCCEDVLWVLRENQSSVIAQLEVFIHEPIFYGREIRPSDRAQKGILERVACKLSGNDPAQYKQGDAEFDVPEQVGTLIRIASDAKNYVRHFVGWCPFW